MTRPAPQISIYPTADDLVQGAVAVVTELAQAAVAARGRFTVALAGGGTPRPVYEQLAAPECADRIAWDKVQVFFGDERCVPPTDEQSNYRMAREALLDQVPLPAENVHRIGGEDDPAKAAADYELEMRRVFAPALPPAFDLILLGLGGDGHTVSLFPGTPALREKDRWVVSQFVAVMGAWRVTFTPVLLEAARNLVFLVAGADKADVLTRVLHGPYQPEVLPAQLTRSGDGHTRWMVDAAAATKLETG